MPNHIKTFLLITILLGESAYADTLYKFVKLDCDLNAESGSLDVFSHYNVTGLNLLTSHPRDIYTIGAEGLAGHTQGNCNFAKSFSFGFIATQAQFPKDDTLYLTVNGVVIDRTNIASLTLPAHVDIRTLGSGRISYCIAIAKSDQRNETSCETIKPHNTK